MWHIPINASEKSLLYAVETFVQFESMLRIFDSTINEKNLDWWERLEDDLKKYYEEGEENSQKIYKHLEIALESHTIAERSAGVQFEIERDMRVQPGQTQSGKIPVQYYVETIAARYPLLGMAVLDEPSRKIIEQAALQAIKHSLDQLKVDNWAYLSVLLTVIQYAKDWNRTENAGFWAYMAEQFGYKDSPQIYDILTMSVRSACLSYNRFFMVDLNGTNNYYTTVLAHALSPNKSFYALCEFLFKFYKSNLDCSVYEDDPAINRMVCVLRERCQGASIEHDEDIRGNIYGVQAGLKALITSRPGYMKHFLTGVLLKIGSLLVGGELQGKEYLDILLTRWYINKLAEPSMSIPPAMKTISSAPLIKKNAPVHKRTTDIAFTYGRIQVEYVLDDEGEPALRIPSIRLANRDNPVIFIRSDGADAYQQIIGIYGNEYAATSEEVVIPLVDICDADLSNLEVIIAINGKQVFSSGGALRAKALLFYDGKLHTGKNIDEGNYTLFAPKSVNIRFEGYVDRQRRSYVEQLYDIFIEGDVSIFADGILMYCSQPPEKALQFKLPKTQLNFVLRERSYPVYSRIDFTLTAVGVSDINRIAATTQNGERLIVQSLDDNLWRFIPPHEEGWYSVTLSDDESGRVFDETKFYIADSYAVNFDHPYYLESSEDGNVALDINGEHFELPLMGFREKVKFPFGNGELHIKIPRILLLLDGKPLPKDVLWKGEISPSGILQVMCPESLLVSLFFGDSQIKRRSGFGGYYYAIGNAIQAYDGKDDKVSVILSVAGDTLPIFEIVFKMSLSEPPIFSLNGNSLMWLNSHSFMGDKGTKLKYVFMPKHGNQIIFKTNYNERTLSEEFPSNSERYRYQVYAQNETAFGIIESLLHEGQVIFGDRAAVIFQDEILRITRVIMDGIHTDIKPVFADVIEYIGTKSLGYTDLSGDYAQYTAKLFFMTKYGRRYFTNLNPVEIFLVNEKAGRLHISFDGGEGLFIYKNDDYAGELYIHTDPPPKLARYFFIPDFYEYEYVKGKTNA